MTVPARRNARINLREEERFPSAFIQCGIIRPLKLSRLVRTSCMTLAMVGVLSASPSWAQSTPGRGVGGLGAPADALAAGGAGLGAQTSAIGAAGGGATGPGGGVEQSLPQAVVPTPAPVLSKVAAPPPPSTEALEKTVTFKTIDVQGVKALDQKTAHAFFTPLAGKTLKVKALSDACAQLTQAYQKAGYALSFCFVPHQDFANGVARVVAVEGRISELKIEGDPGRMRTRIDTLAAPLLKEAPLRTATFQRFAALLNAIPGLTAQANAAPPTRTDGQTPLVVKVDHRRPVSLVSGVDLNHPGIQGLVGVAENGNLGLGEKITVSALVPPGPLEQHYYAGQWLQPLGSRGLAMQIDAVKYDGQPRNTGQLPGYLKNLQFQDKVSAGLTYPFILTQTESLIGSASVYAAREGAAIHNTITGLELGTREDVRAGQLSLAWTKQDSVGKSTVISRAQGSVSRGVSAFGASKEGYSNFGATVADPVDLAFWKFAGEGSRIQEWSNGWGYQLAGVGQWSPDSLPSAEQLSLGSTRFGLGYPAGAFSGDKGFGLSAQFYHAWNFGFKWVKRVSPYVAADMGRVWTSHSLTRANQLASAGIGVKLTDNKHYSLDLSLAKPVGDAPTDAPNRPLRVNAMFAYQFN